MGALSVFTGGFELDAVEGICADDSCMADLLDVVASLVDKSILVRDDEGGKRRGTGCSRPFALSARTSWSTPGSRPIRGADTATGTRSSSPAPTRSGSVACRGTGWPAWTANTRTCARRSSSASPNRVRRRRPCALSLSLPLLYWRLRGLFSEGRGWLDRALAQEGAPTVLRTRALLLASHLAVWQGNIDGAMPMLDEGDELARRLDAANELAFALLVRGLATLFRNDLAGSVDTLEQGLATLSAAPQPDLELRLDLLNVLGVATGLAPDRERAVACHRQMLAITEPRGEGFYRSRAMWARGLAAWRQGKLEEGAELERESLRIKQLQGSADRYGTAHCLEALAWITADQQRHARAATLLGAADALWTDLGTPSPRTGHLIGHHDACERQSRTPWATRVRRRIPPRSGPAVRRRHHVRHRPAARNPRRHRTGRAPL